MHTVELRHSIERRKFDASRLAPECVKQNNHEQVVRPLFWPGGPLRSCFIQSFTSYVSNLLKKKMQFVKQISLGFTFHEGAFCLFFVRWGSTTSVLGLAQCFSKLRAPIVVFTGCLLYFTLLLLVC